MCVRRSNVNIMAISVWVGGNLAVVVVVFWYWRALPKSRGICNLVIADYWSGQKSPFLLSSSSESNSRETRRSFLGPILDEIPNWAEEDFVTNCEFWIESDSYCRAAKVGHFYDFLHSVNWRTLLGVVVVATAGRQQAKVRLDNHIIFPCQVAVLMAILSCGCRAIELNLIGRDCKSTLCIRQRMCVWRGEPLQLLSYRSASGWFNW